MPEPESRESEPAESRACDASLLLESQALTICTGLRGLEKPSPLSSGAPVLEASDLLLELGDIGQNRPSDDRGFFILSTPAS